MLIYVISFDEIVKSTDRAEVEYVRVFHYGRSLHGLENSVLSSSKVSPTLFVWTGKGNEVTFEPCIIQYSIYGPYLAQSNVRRISSDKYCDIPESKGSLINDIISCYHINLNRGQN